MSIERLKRFLAEDEEPPPEVDGDSVERLKRFLSDDDEPAPAVDGDSVERLKRFLSDDDEPAAALADPAVERLRRFLSEDEPTGDGLADVRTEVIATPPDGGPPRAGLLPGDARRRDATVFVGAAPLVADALARGWVDAEALAAAGLDADCDDEALIAAGLLSEPQLAELEAERAARLETTGSGRRVGFAEPVELPAHLRVEEQLGSGGMAVVYAATDLRLNRRVAIKLLRDRASDARAVERLLREAQLVSQLDHPNIITIHEVGLARGPEGSLGVPYLVMALADQASFRELLDGLSRRERVEHMLRVASAIGHAHENGVVHRDLKPENVLVKRGSSADEPASIWVGDFGLARRTEHNSEALTRTGAVMGTLPYMAPEQVLGLSDQVGPATDVWALGVMLYEQLTGQLPFRGPAAELYTSIPNAEPAAPRTQTTDVPRDLQTICLVALEKEPARRYADARALADDLRRYLDDQPIQARPTSLRYRLYKRLRRNVWAAISVAALLLVVVTLVGWRWREANLEAERRAERERWQRLEHDLADARRAGEEWTRQRYGPAHPLGSHRRRLRGAQARLRGALDAGAFAGEPTEADAQGLLGWLSFELGSVGEAIAALERARSNAPEDGVIRFRLGLALMRSYQRRHREAMRVRANPRAYRQRMALAKARASEAATEFQQALAHLDPEQPPTWMRPYAEAYLAWIQMDNERAVERCRAVVAAHPLGGEEALLLLGEMAAQRATLAMSQAVASAIAGQVTQAAASRAEAVAAWTQAIEHFAEAIDRARSWPRGYVALVRARLSLLDTGSLAPGEVPMQLASALHEANTARRIDEGDPEVRLALTRVHLFASRQLYDPETSIHDPDALRAAADALRDAYGAAVEATLITRDAELSWRAWLMRGLAAAASWRLLAEHQPARARRWFGLARRALDQAVEREPAGSATALSERARLFFDRSAAGPRAGGRACRLCAAALADYERAIAVDPSLESVFRANILRCKQLQAEHEKQP